jgi:rSAM/selenodomain-associated transferase 2
MQLGMLRLAMVVPVLQESAGIVAFLLALQPLRAQGHQVIVVDGGSTDNTAELAAPLCDRLLRAQSGRASQMNAGAARCDADVLVFLHADTQLPATAVVDVQRAIQAGALWGRFDVRIIGHSLWLPVVAHFMNARSRLSGIATGDQAMFVRRDTFESLGGFAVLPLMEDIELSARLRRLARPACLTSRVQTSGRRWDVRGPWRTIFLMWRLRWRYWRGESAASLARAYR